MNRLWRRSPRALTSSGLALGSFASFMNSPETSSYVRFSELVFMWTRMYSSAKALAWSPVVICWPAYCSQGVLLGLRLESVSGRHRDALLAELLLDILVDEVAGVGQQATCDEEDNGQDEAGPRDELVKRLAHRASPLRWEGLPFP